MFMCTVVKGFGLQHGFGMVGKVLCLGGPTHKAAGTQAAMGGVMTGAAQRNVFSLKDDDRPLKLKVV